MLIKKRFSVVQIEEERKFLEEKIASGFIPYKIDYQGYYFKEGQKYKSPHVIIEFFYIDDDLLEDFYISQGYKLLFKRKTDKGVWLYFVSEGDKVVKKREDDYQKLMKNISSRLDVFWLVIFSAILVFSIFMTVFQGKRVFFLLIIVSLGFMIYLFFVKKNIKSMIKKLK